MKFCLLSDTHRGYSKKQAELLHIMLEEIGEQSPDIILHAGDVGSHNQHHAHDFWKTLRRIHGLETIPVVYVFGNHDYWGKGNWFEAERKALSNEARFNVTRLDGSAYQIPFTNIVIFGFSGWYAQDNMRSNDRHNISNYDFDYFRTRADKHIAKIVELYNESLSNSSTLTRILLTHFDFIPIGSDSSFQEQPSLLSIFSEMDYIISGHSHKRVNGIVLQTIPKKVVYYNPGGDYEKPKYLMLDIK